MKNNKVLAIILGGGKGSRLFPLTQERCKPAISFGGKYRLIDVPISNCLHSGINQIFILTQFMTASLHRHIFTTYQLDMVSKGFIEVLAAEQTYATEKWYQGNADAVRRSIRYIKNYPIDYVLILSGDQLCRMNYTPILDFHRRQKADLTVIGHPIPGEEASRMGIMKVDENHRILSFLEKTKDPAARAGFEIGVDQYLASTGNYIFNRDVLLDVLASGDEDDFGKHIIPRTAKRGNTCAFVFNGYWEDVGTIKSFYQANLDLATIVPQFNLYDEAMPIFTRARFLPAAKVQKSVIDQSLISEGCLIENAIIENSVIGIRSVIRSGAIIRNSILLGNDYYSQSIEGITVAPEIGRNVHIENAIIDKNVVIGHDSRIIGSPEAPDANEDLYCVRDGIVVLSKGANLPPNTVITPQGLLRKSNPDSGLLPSSSHAEQ